MYISYVLVNVYVPKDRVTSLHQGYGFVEFRSEEDADYVCISFKLKLFSVHCLIAPFFVIDFLIAYLY